MAMTTPFPRRKQEESGDRLETGLFGDELEDSLFEDQVYQVEDEGLNKDAMTGAEITMENKEEEIPPELDGSIAEILGADPTAITQFSDDIHKDLACRLEHIATKGLSKREHF
ncbi:uncharacterized protein [Choristoneura fumiferana]|uniref:uncharacterized protein n=1 Tax=Choristoneura fumiferana TaxID=7141 RepID=UPI003D15796D